MPPPPLRFTSRGRISEFVLAAHFVASEFCCKTEKTKRSQRDHLPKPPLNGGLPAIKGKRSAERRIVLRCPHRQTSLRNSSVRGCVPCGTPPFGAHACGTRHRLLPRWLSSRTGFPAAAANESFARFAQKMPRLSTLRADRSLCRSTGDPKPPGSESDEPPRAGTASRYRQFGVTG
jgi:hypothetical protein